MCFWPFLNYLTIFVVPNTPIWFINVSLYISSEKCTFCLKKFFFEKSSSHARHSSTQLTALWMVSWLRLLCELELYGCMYKAKDKIRHNVTYELLTAAIFEVEGAERWRTGLTISANDPFSSTFLKILPIHWVFGWLWHHYLLLKQETGSHLNQHFRNKF